jgi:hypothetical protein
LAPVLVLPDNNDHAWHSVMFLSKALNPVEQNYEIHDTEILAIIIELEEWRYYLEGVTTM